MTAITLTKFELFTASMVGVRRKIASMGSGMTNHVNNKDYGWHVDIEAAAAEMAFAKFIGSYWDYSVYKEKDIPDDSDFNYKDPDVGKYQVRHTAHKNGHLILRERDKPNELYWLVTGDSPNFNIVGWLQGSACMIDSHLRMEGGKQVWWTPQNKLNNPESIRGK